MLYPNHFEQKIDFTSIRKLLKDKCTSTLGAELVDQIEFSADYEEIHTFLSQTDEMKQLLTSDKEDLPIGDFYDVRSALSRIRVEGLFLDEGEVFGLWRALEAVRKLVAFLTKDEDKPYPYISNLLPGIETFPAIIRRIESLLNKFGKLKDNASPELGRIRKDIHQVESSVSRTLNAILKQAQADGYVERDVAPTMRDGRLVIPVSPAFKRKVTGIVHDESATGKTVFIEPQQVVEANNRIREALQNDDLPKLLANYDNKAMMALASRYLKSSKLVDFESWLARVLRNNKVPALTTAIRKILPTIQPQ